MSAQPAALYGPPVGRHDENVPTSLRVMLIQGVLLLAGLFAGPESAVIASRTPGYSSVTSTAWAIALMLLAGWALLTAGMVLLRKAEYRSAGALLGAASLAWFMAQWDSAWARSAVAFGVGLVLGSVCPVFVAHAVLRLNGRLGRLDEVATAFSYAGAVVVAGLAKALFFDPRTAGCSECPPNPWLTVDSPAILAAVDAFAGVVSVMWSGLLIAALVLRSMSYTPAQRRILFLVTAVAIGYLAAVFVSYVLELGRDAPAQAAAGAWLWLAQAVLLVALAAATAWPAIALRLTRYRLVRLLVDATRAPPIGGLSTALAALLHDPSARLLYPLAGGQLVNATGVVSQLPDADSAATRLTRGEQTVAYLIHRPAALDDATVGEVVQAVRLGLDNERLHAEREAQLGELRESRRRIVATADRERRSLERDLHDGAQQKVVALALTLRLARLRSLSGDVSSVQLAEAEDEVAAVLAELRTVARGLFPTELADEGLEAALESFTESSSSPITIDASLSGRLPSSVESAAYFSVVHLSESAHEGPTSARVLLDGATLRLEINISQDVGDSFAVEDRVGALGGTVEVDPAGGSGRLIKIELPCES
jgi:signal transduction histidine kinase